MTKNREPRLAETIKLLFGLAAMAIGFGSFWGVMLLSFALLKYVGLK